MTPTKTAAILRRLADDWRHEEAQLCKQFGDVIVPRSMRARRIKDTEAIDAAVEMIERLEAAEKEREEIEPASPVPATGYSNQFPLYALPSAGPEPSINEGVRKVTLDFRWESEAQHHIPTIEIEFEPVSPESPNDAKGWQDRDRIASMLSPEAKP